MKSYFSKKVFVLSATAVLAISSMFILKASDNKPSPKREMIGYLLKANINNSAKIFNLTTKQINDRLTNSGLKPNGDTILKIAKNNAVSPFKIVAIITEKTHNK
jgi:hypothetical protein